MGVTHFEEARTHDYALGHLTSHWTLLGESAGSVRVGVRRIEIAPGFWSTPAHDHGRAEEIFYVLAGRGISWHGGRTAEVRAGDCILYGPRRGGHSLHAIEPLDVLAFGPREYDEAVGFPRLDHSLSGLRAVASTPGVVDRAPFQFRLESDLGAPELGEEPGPRPKTIVNVSGVASDAVTRPRVQTFTRDLGVAAGSLQAGLRHVEVGPGKWGSPLHCHSAEEELFVVLGGTGTLELGRSEVTEEIPLRAGHVIARPAGTGVAHALRAGEDGLTYLAYGTREPNDFCFYPRSNKLGLPGDVFVRIQPLDYWDGED